MFQLTDTEFKNLKFHFGTSSWGGTRKLPNVFSEQGVAMLSGVLTSDRAILVNIQIMRIFIHTRKMLADNSDLRSEIEYIKQHLNKQDATLGSHEKNMEVVFSYLDELMEKKAKPRRRIGYMPDEL